MASLSDETAFVDVMAIWEEGLAEEVDSLSFEAEGAVGAGHPVAVLMLLMGDEDVLYMRLTHTAMQPNLLTSLACLLFSRFFGREKGLDSYPFFFGFSVLRFPRKANGWGWGWRFFFWVHIPYDHRFLHNEDGDEWDDADGARERRGDNMNCSKTLLCL